VECKSKEDVGGEHREEVRKVRDGRCGAWIERVVERGWMETCESKLEVEVAVVGRVDGEGGLECAMQDFEVESVEATDTLSVCVCVCKLRGTGGDELKSS
jgi:hypothetical protein